MYFHVSSKAHKGSFRGGYSTSVLWGVNTEVQGAMAAIGSSQSQHSGDWGESSRPAWPFSKQQKNSVRLSCWDFDKNNTYVCVSAWDTSMHSASSGLDCRARSAVFLSTGWSSLLGREDSQKHEPKRSASTGILEPIWASWQRTQWKTVARQHRHCWQQRISF